MLSLRRGSCVIAPQRASRASPQLAVEFFGVAFSQPSDLCARYSFERIDLFVGEFQIRLQLAHKLLVSQQRIEQRQVSLAPKLCALLCAVKVLLGGDGAVLTSAVFELFGAGAQLVNKHNEKARIKIRRIIHFELLA